MPDNGVRTFVIASCGQFVAFTGMTLLNDAAAYQIYGSYSLTVYGLISALPIVLVLVASPIAGSLVDRRGVRRALVVSNVGFLLVAVLAMPFRHTFVGWFGVLILMADPLLKALLLPALEASVPLLLPKRHIGRANGYRMFFSGVSALLGPFVAVLLLRAVGTSGLALLVCLTSVLGLSTLLPIRIPRVLP